MKKLITLALFAALCAPATAQKMGSVNSNAPTMKQSMEMGSEKMTLNYTAIRWAEGSTMKMSTSASASPVRARTRSASAELAKCAWSFVPDSTKSPPFSSYRVSRRSGSSRDARE